MSLKIFQWKKWPPRLEVSANRFCIWFSIRLIDFRPVAVVFSCGWIWSDRRKALHSHGSKFFAKLMIFFLLYSFLFSLEWPLLIVSDRLNQSQVALGHQAVRSQIKKKSLGLHRRRFWKRPFMVIKDYNLFKTRIWNDMNQAAGRKARNAKSTFNWFESWIWRSWAHKSSQVYKN